jgi:hypothetical protein
MPIRKKKKKAQELRGEGGGSDLVEQHELFYALATAVLAASPPVAPDVLERVWKARRHDGRRAHTVRPLTHEHGGAAVGAIELWDF